MNINNLKAFANIPDSMLKSVGTSQPSQPSPSSVFDTGAHTEQPPLSQGGNTTNNPGSQPSATATGATKPIGAIVGDKGGIMAAALMNLLIPALCVYIIRKIGYRVSRKELEMSESEKTLSATAWQMVLDKMMVDVSNPWPWFALTHVFIFGSKIMLATQEAEKVAQKKTEEKEEKPLKAKDVVEKVKEQATVVPMQPPVNKDELFRNEYAREKEKMIVEATKKRRKGRVEAATYLSKQRKFDELEMQIKKKIFG